MTKQASKEGSGANYAKLPKHVFIIQQGQTTNKKLGATKYDRLFWEN